MGETALNLDGHFYYRDYRRWPAEEHWELVDGVPCAMASPSFRHQELLLRIARLLADFLDDKPCKLIVAPFDVLRLPVTRMTTTWTR